MRWPKLFPHPFNKHSRFRGCRDRSLPRLLVVSELIFLPGWPILTGAHGRARSQKVQVSEGLQSSRGAFIIVSGFSRDSTTHWGRLYQLSQSVRYSRRHQLVAAWAFLVRQNGPVFRSHRQFNLTACELDVIRAVVTGRPNKEIAQQFSINDRIDPLCGRQRPL